MSRIAPGSSWDSGMMEEAARLIREAKDREPEAPAPVSPSSPAAQNVKPPFEPGSFRLGHGPRIKVSDLPARSEACRLVLGFLEGFLVSDDGLRSEHRLRDEVRVLVGEFKRRAR